MKLFKLFCKEKDTPVDSIAEFMYKALSEEKYAQYPYRKEELGDDMFVIKQAICGYWKPVYLIDDRNKGAEVFMNEAATLIRVSVAEVSWQINPDGSYYMDEDGFGMTNDKEITIYSFVDRSGSPLVKFCYIHNVRELAKMEKEARKNLKTKIRENYE